jgi:hypothetical protein
LWERRYCYLTEASEDYHPPAVTTVRHRVLIEGIRNSIEMAARNDQRRETCRRPDSIPETGIMGITQAIILVLMGEVTKIRTQRDKT